jgi:hypothetical protein
LNQGKNSNGRNCYRGADDHCFCGSAHHASPLEAALRHCQSNHCDREKKRQHDWETDECTETRKYDDEQGEGDCKYSVTANQL